MTKKDKEKIQLVEYLNSSLGEKFNVVIVGAFDNKPDWSDEDDEKYIEILDADGECYMDWYFENRFNTTVLRKYAEKIPLDQGKGSDDTSKEYLELSNRILEAIKNYKK